MEPFPQSQIEIQLKLVLKEETLSFLDLKKEPNIL